MTDWLAFTFTATWFLLTVAVAAAEAASIMLRREAGRRGHDKGRLTLSWHVWWLNHRPFWRATVFALWAWVGYHWWLEPAALAAAAWDDAAVTVAAWTAGRWLIVPVDSRGR
jgi:hypothetical protein